MGVEVYGGWWGVWQDLGMEVTHLKKNVSKGKCRVGGGV